MLSRLIARSKCLPATADLAVGMQFMISLIFSCRQYLVRCAEKDFRREFVLHDELNL